MENEFTTEIDKEIRRRGHFTIYDDGSVQIALCEMLKQEENSATNVEE